MSFVSGITTEMIVFAMMAVIVILLTCLTVSIINSVKLRRIMKNCSSGRLDESITLYYNKISELASELDKKTAQFEQLEKMIDAGVQKFAVVRYNAFDDISNNLSFSAAMLDGSNTGFVLTSIYGRENSSAYIKSILKGKSNATMSDEEVEAYERAIAAYENKLK